MKSKIWTVEVKAKLFIMAKSMSDNEIGKKIGCTKGSVQFWRARLGIPPFHPMPSTAAYFREQAIISRLPPARFPTFENITIQESRRISAGSPKSARYTKQYRDYSLTGNAGEMCAP